MCWYNICLTGFLDDFLANWDSFMQIAKNHIPSIDLSRETYSISSSEKQKLGSNSPILHIYILTRGKDRYHNFLHWLLTCGQVFLVLYKLVEFQVYKILNKLYLYYLNISDLSLDYFEIPGNVT